MLHHRAILSDKIFGIFGLVLALQGGCLKNPSAAVSSQDIPLTISGVVEDSLGQAASGIEIFVEQETQPEQVTGPDGSFSFSWSAARMEELRFRYTALGQPLRLYFIKAGTPGESAVYDKMKVMQIGNLDAGVIRLQNEVIISGQVSGPRAFGGGVNLLEGALVHVGRFAALTDVDGRFALFAPAQSLLPVRISQKGYVQTRGSWNVGAIDETRDFRLYDRLSVEGSLGIPTNFRNDDPSVKTLTLAVSGNALSRWVRIGLSEEELLNSSKWISLDDKVEVPRIDGASMLILYQFADQNKQTLSPIYSLEL